MSGPVSVRIKRFVSPGGFDKDAQVRNRTALGYALACDSVYAVLHAFRKGVFTSRHVQESGDFPGKQYIVNRNVLDELAEGKKDQLHSPYGDLYHDGRCLPFSLPTTKAFLSQLQHLRGTPEPVEDLSREIRHLIDLEMDLARALYHAIRAGSLYAMQYAFEHGVTGSRGHGFKAWVCPIRSWHA